MTRQGRRRAKRREMPSLLDCTCVCADCTFMGGRHQHSRPCDDDTAVNKVAFYKHYKLGIPADLLVPYVREVNSRVCGCGDSGHLDESWCKGCNQCVDCCECAEFSPAGGSAS